MAEVASSYFWPAAWLLQCVGPAPCARAYDGARMLLLVAAAGGGRAGPPVPLPADIVLSSPPRSVALFAPSYYAARQVVALEIFKKHFFISLV